MKPLLKIALILSCVGTASAQSVTTPNIQLNTPYPNAQNWNFSWNSNATKLDLLLSGNSPLSSLTFKVQTSTTTPGMGTVRLYMNTDGFLHVRDANGNDYALGSGGGGGGVPSVFGRTGAITAQNGDYSVSLITGAAPLASPSFSGTVSILSLSDGCLQIASHAVISTGSACGSSGGSGTVSPGTTGQFAYYSANGTVVAGRTLVAGDIPLLNQNTTGTAAGLSANLPVSKLNSGTNAATGKYWEGSGTWTPPGIDTCTDATGSTTAYSCTSANGQATTNGKFFAFKPQTTNTASSSLTINGVTWVLKKQGNNLVAGDVIGGQWYTVISDGVFWNVTSRLGTDGSGGGSVTWPATGDIVLSNSTSSPAGLAPVNGNCVVGSGGVWTAGACSGSSGTNFWSSGTGVPTANCAPGSNYYQDTTAVNVGTSLYFCSATNVWSPLFTIDTSSGISYGTSPTNGLPQIGNNTAAVPLKTAANSFSGIQTFGAGLINGSITFSALSALSSPVNGTLIYCSDCLNAHDDSAVFDSTAAGSGHGTNVLRENGAWRVH